MSINNVMCDLEPVSAAALHPRLIFIPYLFSYIPNIQVGHLRSYEVPLVFILVPYFPIWIRELVRS